MLLEKLIKSIPNNYRKIKVKNLALDSRKVKKNYLFFALPGSKTNGKKYILEAEKKGACAVIFEGKLNLSNIGIPAIKVKNIRKEIANACRNFYAKKPKNIIAVTGTNGKSSVVQFYYQILSNNKIPVASIGTLGVYSKKIKKTNLTSPDIITLHTELSNLKRKGIDNVIIEASSHGLKQERLGGLKIKTGIFTNFSQDHLDYHKSMKEYFNSKMILFKDIIHKNGIIITDCELKEFKYIKKISKARNLKIVPINDLKIPKKNKPNLIGDFQTKNLLMAIVAANQSKVSKLNIFKKLKYIKNVNGRLELVKTFPNKVKVFIDYAHTPDALNTVLASLKKQYSDNINLVFGCGGERDRKKRKFMALTAKKFSNLIFVTDDNPRNENPKSIRRDITKHLTGLKYFDIPSRKKAIISAIKNSKPGEIILIAGKGHETYQDYGQKILNISDKNIVRNFDLPKKTFIKFNNFTFNSNILKKILKTKKDFKFEGISINSKKIKKNNIFVAIKGKKFDGHSFVNEAIRKGSKYCVVSKNKLAAPLGKIIKVKNTLKFLQKFSSLKRQNLKANIIAITGSSGKTTVKTVLGSLLQKFHPTYYSPKSFNNHFGVPLSLSNLERKHTSGVFEVGMSKAGEIDRLTKIIKPDIGVITNIGEAHIENFKNISYIAKAKGELIDNIKKDGTLLLNRDDRFFNYFLKRAKKNNIKNIISIGFSEKSDVKIRYYKLLKKQQKLIIKIKKNHYSIISPIINPYSLTISLTIMNILNIDIKKSLKYFKNIYPLDGRGKYYNIKRFNTSFKLIDETYNANPYSVKNAIKKLSESKNNTSKKYILLSDMLELGKKSEFYHKDLSKIINKADIDKVFVYGDKILNTYKKIKIEKRGNILQNKSDFDEVFSNIISKNDILMMKGSNAMGLNQIVKQLRRGTNVI